MRRSGHRLFMRLLLALALAGSTWLALTSRPPTLPEFVHADKLAHAATYLLLAFLVDYSWPSRGFGPPKWSFLLAYGVAIELLQSQTPNRHFSLADIGANAAGIALYASVVTRLLRMTRMR